MKHYTALQDKRKSQWTAPESEMAMYLHENPLNLAGLVSSDTISPQKAFERAQKSSNAIDNIAFYCKREHMVKGIRQSRGPWTQKITILAMSFIIWLSKMLPTPYRFFRQPTAFGRGPLEAKTQVLRGAFVLLLPRNRMFLFKLLC